MKNLYKNYIHEYINLNLESYFFASTLQICVGFHIYIYIYIMPKKGKIATQNFPISEPT